MSHSSRSMLVILNFLPLSNVYASPIDERPNVVVCIADDWSFPHTSILVDPVVKTPNFDRVAREGVLFENAFVSTPSCTPSRLSILTGQHHWRLKEGDSLGGSLREEFDVYTEMLQTAGYRIGRYGKGVRPSKHQFRKRDSFGERYKSIEEFLKDRKPDEPFCFWFGGQDPHRPYEFGIGKRSGIALEEIPVPPIFPDNESVRSDLADYYWEVQRFDRQLGTVLSTLESIGELENTIVVVTSDNGMPFPRCKATLYDLGVRVPLAIRWGSKVPSKGRRVSDFVSLCDLAPTFLEACGLKPPAAMTGRSLLTQLQSTKTGQIDASRTFVLCGVEKHVYLTPRRSIRTADSLYIRNFVPQNWPTGEIEGHNPRYDFATDSWPTEPGAFSFNIDPSPTKQLMRLQRTESNVQPIAAFSFTRPPPEELYDLKNDPHQIHNVAASREFQTQLSELRSKLCQHLLETSDPRAAECSK